MTTYKEFCEYYHEHDIQHVNGLAFYCDYIQILNSEALRWQYLLHRAENREKHLKGLDLPHLT